MTARGEGGRGRALITGGTGNTGRRITLRLAELGFPVRVASRGAPPPDSTGEHVRFDWADTPTHEKALEGMNRIYLVAPTAVDDPSTLMLPFIELALAKGVQRLVLLSSSAIPDGSPGLGAVERFLRERAPAWAVLKPSWFMQNFVDQRHPHWASLMREGKIVTATGAGRVGFVDADDIAEVGVRALADDEPHNTAHVITGPEALSYGDVAAILSRITGRPMRHEAVDDDTARRRLMEAGMPERYAALLVGLDAAIRDGAEDRVTDTVERVTGRAPNRFASFARAHAQVFQGA